MPNKDKTEKRKDHVMGNRATIIVTDKVNHDGVAAIYLHWAGENAVEYLKVALPRMRRGDSAYSTARLIGEIHNRIDGNLSLGVYPILPDKTDMDPGDNGIVFYNCETGKLSFFPLRSPLAKRYPANERKIGRPGPDTTPSGIIL